MQGSTGYLRDAHDKTVRVQYVLADPSAQIAGTQIASDDGRGMVLYRVNGLLRTATQITGWYGDTWTDASVTWLQRGCTRGTLRVPVRSDPTLYAGVVQQIAISGSTTPFVFRLPSSAAKTIVVPLQPKGGVCTIHFAITPTRRPVDYPALNNPDPRGSACSSRASSTSPRRPSEDRRRRLAALAPAHRRRQLHPRLAAGLVEAGGDEIVAFAPASRARQARDRGGARWDRGRAAAAGAPCGACRRAPRGAGSAGRRRSGSSAASTSSTSATGCIRRSGPGVRSTMMHDLVPLHHPGVGARAHAADARREVPQRARKLRRRDRQLPLHRRRRRRDARRSAGAHPRRLPGRRCRLHGRRDRLDLGRPYALTVATLEPRKNLATLVEAHRLLGGELALAVAGAAGWGEQAKLDVAGIVRLGYTAARRAAAALPRRERRRLPVALRGLRHADRRGDGVRRSRRRVVAPVTGRGLRRRRRARRSARTRTRSRRRSATRSSVATSSSPKGLEHARAFTWLANGRAHLAAWESAR